MQTTTIARTCTYPWCNNVHVDDSDLHLQEDVHVEDLYGHGVAVSLFFNSTTGRAGVYVGDSEVSPTAARELASALLASADLADRVTARRLLDGGAR